ncbi:5-(carboxyamino)imidazole ribonucleotide synthase [Polynucleobacter sp. HIN5]|nr:5-(carboxyamino)imidazole ribonucleotide synthase [Polynucleobacter sp. HIN5]
MMSSSHSSNLKHQSAILPPAWLGILGGGQLGRMFVHEAQSLGYKVCVLDPDPLSPGGAVAEKHFCANYDDANALQEMAALCATISTEFENVPAKTLDYFEEQGIFVAPRGACVSIAQDRIVEKQFLEQCQGLSGIGPAPYAVIRSESDLAQLPDHLFPGILKTSRLGYDGKGQVTVHQHHDLAKAWQDLGSVACVLEKRMPLALEVSALVVRGHDGQSVAYPISENVHRNGILHTSTVPSPSLQTSLVPKIIRASQLIAERMGYVGVLCVEYFVLDDQTVIVNEIAPRPHNSGHYTMDACVTSQFEQQVRAMARLPLGDVRLLTNVSMLNILGDAWFSSGTAQEPAWNQVLDHPSAKLHLYGKASPKHGRKMGHINCLGHTIEEAKQACAEVANHLGIDP